MLEVARENGLTRELRHRLHTVLEEIATAREHLVIFGEGAAGVSDVGLVGHGTGRAVWWILLELPRHLRCYMNLHKQSDENYVGLK